MNPTSTNDKTKRLFLEARELPEPDQEQFVRTAAEADHSLAERVLKLLQAERSAAAEAISTPVIDLTELRRAAQPTPGACPGLGEKFRAVRAIGFGGSGDVYLCEQISPVRREVAIKLLRPTTVSDADVRRIEREARMLAGLDHPGIARLLDVGKADDGRPFIAMEFADGLPIDRDCQEHAAPIRERLALFRELCDAVRHAHQRGVIHRDIKPANVLVDRSGGRPRVRLIDLGVAKLIDGDRSQGPSITVTGAVVGSLGFMSPEQRVGARASTLSDIYSLGILLYCLLTDGPPPAIFCEDQRTLIRASPQTKPLRGELGTIIARAIAPKPEDRYETVGELDGDIERYLNHEPILARGPSGLYVAGKFIRRHWAASAATGVALVIALASFVLINASRLEAIRAHEEAEAQYTEARRISNYFLRDVATRLYRVPGSQEIQFDLLNELLRQTDSFLEARPDDPELLDDRARTLHALADVHAREPGGYAEAKSLLRESLAVRERLLAIRPDHPEDLMHLGIARVRLGDIAFAERRHEECYEHFMLALEIDKKLFESEPDSRRYLDNLFWSYDRVAQFLRYKGDPGAKELARVALEHATLLGERFPDHYLTLLALSRAHGQYGRVLNSLGLQEDASHYFKTATDYADDLTEVYPDSWYFLWQSMSIHMSTGGNAEELGDIAGAREAYERWREIADRLIEAEPDKESWRRQADEARERLGALDDLERGVD